MPGRLARSLGKRTIRTATLSEPQHGLSEQVLNETDVLLWWGHAGHDLVEDSVVERVHQRVLQGMGLIPLHSAHMSKIFGRLMGTSCTLRWREAGERERVWCVQPAHPLAAGLSDEFFEIEQSEMYGEHFDIPAPDELVFVSWFEGGEVFRSGCVFYRGAGRIFYFSPGHETYPIYRSQHVHRILANAVRWASPGGHLTRAREEILPSRSTPSRGRQPAIRNCTDSSANAPQVSAACSASCAQFQRRDTGVLRLPAPLLRAR